MRKFVWETPEEINMQVATNMKNLRKRRKITQKRLSELTGVSYASIKRFEETGNINFISLTKIAIELDAIDGIKSLFTGIPYKSIQEVINEQKL
ncbi:MAG: helix-turn-helix transcriptional regulator [Lachnospiraceae bacterium]|nr:helix-turn-helix transcriptional regulator [Lachnospiraceae bacterium]MCI5587151.1 helix-turn-helix transcriptional regulator [Lachnospiraceae bacterium]